MKKIGVVIFSMALMLSTASLSSIAAEGAADVVNATDNVREKVRQIAQEAAEEVKETIEKVKADVSDLKEKIDDASVHAQVNLDAKLSGAEEYLVSTVVFTEDGMMILPRPVKEGKRFIEWNTEADGSGQGYKPGAIVDPADIVLYSIWEDEEMESDLTASALSTGYPEILYVIGSIAIGVVAILLFTRRKKAAVSSTPAKDEE